VNQGRDETLDDDPPYQTLQAVTRIYRRQPGTGETEEATEFLQIYKLDVVAIPTNRSIATGINQLRTSFRQEKGEGRRSSTR